MRMQKIQFRIGELAKHLNVEKFVIRFWEKEFNLATNRSTGGQRFYSQEDVEQFQLIKTLLYDKGFTIAGAKKELSLDPTPETIVGSQKTTLLSPERQAITEKITAVRKQLVALRDLL